MGLPCAGRRGIFQQLTCLNRVYLITVGCTTTGSSRPAPRGRSTTGRGKDLTSSQLQDKKPREGSDWPRAGPAPTPSTNHRGQEEERQLTCMLLLAASRAQRVHKCQFRLLVGGWMDRLE